MSSPTGTILQYQVLLPGAIRAQATLRDEALYELTPLFSPLAIPLPSITLKALQQCPWVAADTPFQQRVREQLLQIPPGHTCTYAELACALGQPQAARAVGQAVGRNRLFWLVPCHRVVAKQGLGGYYWGLALKQQLLDIEQDISIADSLPGVDP